MSQGLKDWARTDKKRQQRTGRRHINGEGKHERACVPCRTCRITRNQHISFSVTNHDNHEQQRTTAARNKAHKLFFPLSIAWSIPRRLHATHPLGPTVADSRLLTTKPVRIPSLSPAPAPALRRHLRLFPCSLVFLVNGIERVDMLFYLILPLTSIVDSRGVRRPSCACSISPSCSAVHIGVPSPPSRSSQAQLGRTDVPR